MSVQTVLNADMATIGRALRNGWSWWLDEVRDLVPARWRGVRGIEPVGAIYDAGRLQWLESGRRAGPWTLLIPTSAALVRRIALPPIRASEVGPMVQLESDRFFPFPQGFAVVANASPERNHNGSTSVDVAALPMSVAREIAGALALQTEWPDSIRLGELDAHTDPRFDFAPAFAMAGLIAPRGGSTRPWWLAVALLFVANLGMLAWRDAADVHRLESLVEQQRPAVALAQRLTERMRRDASLIDRAAQRRAGGGALGLLGQVSSAVPEQAWVQRFDWDGPTLRLAGYRTADLNLRAALRTAPFAASVRNAQTDSLAEVAAGKPFDVTIRLRGH